MQRRAGVLGKTLPPDQAGCVASAEPRPASRAMMRAVSWLRYVRGQLQVHPRQVLFDELHRNAEGRGDVAVGLATGHELRDLPFARRERRRK